MMASPSIELVTVDSAIARKQNSESNRASGAIQTMLRFRSIGFLRT
jgi:hypothetical protein